MAKSKVGGSRAYIRGRIGSDVYSIGKNAKGSRQQVVRSLAEQVSNPRTQQQMFGRMIMSSVMQAVSGLKSIIDHSFDGLPAGQPCISEFIRQNYALVKADAVAHPASGNQFGLVKYQEKGTKLGKYIVSAGSAILPSAVTAGGSSLSIALTADTLTVGGLKAALGLSSDGYLTYVLIDDTYGVQFFRVKLDTTLADATAITSDNVGSLFTLEGNITPSVTLTTNTIYFEPANTGLSQAYGCIVSEKIDGQWIHNNCTLKLTGEAASAADVALPTYPTGSEQFLNGGDL